jgi:hypothetical protein
MKQLRSAAFKAISMAVAGISLALLGIIGVSYHDVSASVGSSSVTLVSLGPDAIHVLVLRWRMGAYQPELDMPGQYVLWTLRPFGRSTGSNSGNTYSA